MDESIEGRVKRFCVKYQQLGVQSRELALPTHDFDELRAQLAERGLIQATGGLNGGLSLICGSAIMRIVPADDIVSMELR